MLGPIGQAKSCSSNFGTNGPPAADRSSLAASDSDAALRQHIQTDDITSSDPRLVEKIVARGSWLVKVCHYTRMGCDEISQQSAQGSLYRGAGRQRRSERLKVGPYKCPDWGYFCSLLPASGELRLFHEFITA